MSWPFHLALLTVLVLGTTVPAWRLGSNRPIAFVGGVPFACIALGLVAVHALVAAVFPRPDVFRLPGFLLGVLLVLANLLVAIARRLAGHAGGARETPGRLAHWGWIALHVGLFLAIACALFGARDLQRLKLVLRVGGTSARLVDEAGKPVGYLPFGLYLQDFQLDEYPPRLALTDSAATEIVTRRTDPVFELGAGAHGILRGVAFGVKIWLAHCEPSGAGLVAVRDSLAPSGAYLVARLPDGRVREGWITCGGYGVPSRTLQCGPVSLAMGVPPARAFRSVVTVLDPGHPVEQAVVEVNRGLSRGGWMLEQLDYDKAAGKASRVSILEAVHDPWFPWVRGGIFLALAGLGAFLAGLVRDEGKAEPRP